MQLRRWGACNYRYTVAHASQLEQGGNMRNGSIGIIVLASLGIMGCTERPQNFHGSSAGSLALSTDQSLLYAVDSDNDAVEILDTQSEKKVGEVKVGRAPERILV